MAARRALVLRCLVSIGAAGWGIGAAGLGIGAAGLGLRVLSCPLAPQVDLAPPEDPPLSPFSPLSPLSPAPSSMGISGGISNGALAGLAATASGLKPFLVARGSSRESKVFLRYPRNTSDPWLKNTAIFSNSWVSVRLGSLFLYSSYLATN